MTGPRTQRRAGFKAATNLTPIEGITSRVTSLNELRAKQAASKYVSRVKSLADNGRKSPVKRIIAKRAKEKFGKLSLKDKPVFEEMLREITLNPAMPIADISVRVVRTLKAKNSGESYVEGTIRRLYHDSVKEGVIAIK